MEKESKTNEALTTVVVYGNGNLGEVAGWSGDHWVMKTTNRFPAGDRREQCGGRDSEYRIHRSRIVSGPTRDGICTNGFGQGWKVTVNTGALTNDLLESLKFEGNTDSRLIESVLSNKDSLELAGLPNNIGSHQLGNGFLVFATDGSGKAIALTFVPNK